MRCARKRCRFYIINSRVHTYALSPLLISNKTRLPTVREKELRVHEAKAKKKNTGEYFFFSFQPKVHTYIHIHTRDVRSLCSTYMQRVCASVALLLRRYIYN